MYQIVRLGLIGLCALATWGQEQPNLFKSASPEVEQALRKRVGEFYKLLEDGRFRQTDAYLAEDAKDIYYEQEKRRIRGHEIIRVNWDDDFKKAVVVTVIQTDVVMRGVSVAVGAPISSRWKLENGTWMMYFDTLGKKESPFGPMKAGPNQTKGMNPEELLKNPRIILDQIKVSKEEARLKSYEKSSDFVEVANGLPGGISVSFVPNQVIPGFTYKVEKAELGAGELTKILFSYDPGKDLSAKQTITGFVRVDPFSKSFPIRITFDIPEEVKKNLPKKP
jgi:hypothetical protein